MNDTAITERLTEIFRDLFFDDDIILTPQTTAKDIEGWDSIKHISLIVAIEEYFGIKMTAKEMEQLDNVSDLETIIASKLGQTAR